VLELRVISNNEMVVLKLEHSLLAVSKWESKFKVAFLTDRQKTPEQMLYYYQCMLVSPEDSSDLIYALSPDQLKQVVEYITETRTAANIYAASDKLANADTPTSDVIYYWMVSQRIPFEAEKWHLSRLLMLTQIISVKQSKTDKRQSNSAGARWRALSERRRAETGSTG